MNGEALQPTALSRTWIHHRKPWAILALVLCALTHPAVARAAVARAAVDQPTPRPLSVDPPPDDAIARRIRSILTALGGTAELDVEVQSGIVRLHGRADSLAVREQASALAERVDGVVLVSNDLQVVTHVRGRFTPIWARLKRYLVAAIGFLPVLVLALLAFLAFAMLASAVGRWERPFARLGLSPLGAKVLRIVARATLLTTGIVLALEILGWIAFVGTVVGALGLVGVVVGIAFRDVVSNHLPGIMLGLNPPFHPGDRVRIGDHEGKVVRVTARETILVTYDGQQLRLPNVHLLQEPIVNLARHRERRLQLSFDVALSANLRNVRDVGQRTLLAEPGLLREPRPSMRVLGIESDHVRVAFFAWADQEASSFPEVESRARQAVKEALMEANVPFPMTEVTIHRGDAPTLAPEEESDGRDEALLDAHVREELATPGERDLLQEGRSRPT
jgi:small-conductance mechanosensitive channel